MNNGAVSGVMDAADVNYYRHRMAEDAGILCDAIERLRSDNESLQARVAELEVELSELKDDLRHQALDNDLL